jgi:hypothetical protein
MKQWLPAIGETAVLKPKVRNLFRRTVPCGFHIVYGGPARWQRESCRGANHHRFINEQETLYSFPLFL